MRYLDFLWSSRFSAVVFWLAVFFVISYIFKWLFIKKGKALIKFLISLIISAGKGIKDNSGINSFFGRHPRLSAFLKKRLDLSKFSGLFLTILALVSVYAIGWFVSIAVDVFVVGNAASVDLSVANLLHAFRNPLLVKIFLWITLLGNWRIVLAIMLAVLVLFWLWDKKNYIMPFLVSVGGSFVTGAIAKYVWHRPRPLEVGVYLEKSWSFPSGHAILAVSLYGFLVYFFWKYFKKWKSKIDAMFLGFLIIILIGFSRLYLGVHYLTDVWAGYMVGIFWLVISIGLVESNVKPSSDIDILSTNKPKYLKSITAGLLCLLVIGYVGYGLNYKQSLKSRQASKEENTFSSLLTPSDYKPLFNPSGEVENIRKIDYAKVNEVFNDYKLPKFTETLLGNPQEPISFIIIADNDEHLIKSFQQSNWLLAESANFNFLATAFKSVILNRAYPTAPMTPYFWQTYTNDFGFQEPTEVNSARYRHHARFWRTDFTTADGKNIYIGITSLDMGVKWWGLTHRIQPDIDSEREYLFAGLNKTAVKSFEKIQFVDPVLGKNFTGDQFFTDGKAYIVYLK